MSGYRTLREALTSGASKVLRRRRDDAAKWAERFLWALRDVDFQVRVGEAVGIIGRNGSGKSTLLKILSRVTTPSEGRAEVRGRVGSLLEVGVGFHPELTGRENVYLSGSIIGMKRREIGRKFDEIAAFSGMERFLDTPVKRYSSGMHVRLGFSVSAHLKPEVLFIDEVLAVGDVEFQGKCRAKMSELVSSGGTVLFVSHNVPAVKALCPRCILLEKGLVVADAPTEEAFELYLAAGSSRQGEGWIADEAPRLGTGEARFRRVETMDVEGRAIDEMHIGDPLRVRATVEVLNPIADAVAELGISTLDYLRIATSFSLDEAGKGTALAPGWYEFSAELDPGLLAHGFAIDVALHHRSGTTIDSVNKTRVIQVKAAPLPYGRDPLVAVQRGYYRPHTRWSPPVITDARRQGQERPQEPR
jgi:lipopolysaccharide transport system ATP-binding protein